MKFCVNKYFFSLFLFSLTFGGWAQNIETTLVKKRPVKAQFISHDNLGALYIVNEGEVKKYNAQMDLLAKTSELALGNISTFDASNALKILVYFQGLSQLVYVDNLLGVRGEPISLETLGYAQTTAICRSYNGGFYIYDQTTNEIIRLSEQLEITAQTGNLGQVVGEMPEVNFMREVNDRLYVNAPNLGVLVFDWYGSYLKTIPVKDATHFVVFANNLYTLKNNKIEGYRLKWNTFFDIPLPELNIRDFSISGNDLVVLTQNELLFYKLSVK